MKGMKGTMALTALVVAVGWSVKTLADDTWATNRFLGGSFDGYGASSLIQTDTNAYTRAMARFTGGSFDGWDTAMKTGIKLQQSGTILLLR